MKSLAIFPNKVMDTYSLFYCKPHYPIANSMTSTKVNVWDLPPEIEEKVALLRMIKPGDKLNELGSRHDNHYIVYIPDDYEVPGLS